MLHRSVTTQQKAKANAAEFKIETSNKQRQNTCVKLQLSTFFHFFSLFAIFSYTLTQHLPTPRR